MAVLRPVIMRSLPRFVVNNGDDDLNSLPLVTKSPLHPSTCARTALCRLTYHPSNHTHLPIFVQK